MVFEVMGSRLMVQGWRGVGHAANYTLVEKRSPKP